MAEQAEAAVAPPSERFPPASRLRDRPSFTAVQKNGRRVSLPHLTLLARPNAFGHDRLGVIASRRLGSAVVRNRAKRRLREIFRREPVLSARRPHRIGLDLVVIPKRALVDDPWPVIVAEFLTALRRLRG